MPARIIEIQTKTSWISFIETACDFIVKNNKSCYLYTEISKSSFTIKFKCSNDSKSIEYISQNPFEVYLFMRFILDLQTHLETIILDIPIQINNN